jgi:hypothetical protein
VGRHDADSQFHSEVVRQGGALQSAIGAGPAKAQRSAENTIICRDRQDEPKGNSWGGPVTFPQRRSLIT